MVFISSTDSFFSAEELLSALACLTEKAAVSSPDALEMNVDVAVF